MPVLKIVIPKGRMFAQISSLFSDADIKVEVHDRHYIPRIGDPEIEAKILKPQNIATLIEMGAHDAGFTGRDWVVESGAEVEEVMDLELDPVRIVSAVPQCVVLEEMLKRRILVASEYAGIASRYLESKGCAYRLLRTFGATEVYPPDDADMIVENVSTGYTLKRHKLKIADEIMRSSTRFIANRKGMEDPWKREKIEELKMLFSAVLNARSRVMIEMNVVQEKLESLVSILPCMRVPTVSKLYGDQGYAIKVAVPRSRTVKLIPQLKKIGATDILEYEFKKVIP